MLPIFLLATVINLSLLFLIMSYSPGIAQSTQSPMLANPLSLLQDSLSSLRCETWFHSYQLSCPFDPFVLVPPLSIKRMVLNILQLGLPMCLSL